MFLIGEVCGASRKASSNNEPTEVSRCHSSQRLKARGRRRRAKLKSLLSIFSMETLSIYVFYFPKKSFTPSHNRFFLLISSRLKCEGLLFQAFTGVHRPCECFTARVNALKSKPSHSKPLKINRKQDSCEWVNAFWGNNYVYIIARIRAREL